MYKLLKKFRDFVFNSQLNTRNKPTEILEVTSSGEDPIVVSDDTDNEHTTDISMATDERESSVIDQKEECSNVDKDIEMESAGVPRLSSWAVLHSGRWIEPWGDASLSCPWCTRVPSQAP